MMVSSSGVIEWVQTQNTDAERGISARRLQYTGIEKELERETVRQVKTDQQP